MKLRPIVDGIGLYDSQESRAFLYLLRHDPLAVVGGTLIGAATIFCLHVLLKLERAGDRSYLNGISLPGSIMFTIPRAYMKHARLGRWSRWPLYLVWLCGGLGTILLVIGLIRL